ncbi:MAG: restriction endonuclease subunit S [Gallionella sp.]|nr:restriction endonuclease subunit S [Gallionella sp.]
MTQAHVRYDAYKDSGIEWLGEVPAHWEVTRNKDIFEERGDLSISGDETLLTVSHITGVTRRSEKNVNMFMAETMEGYKLCQTGDLIINTMWAWMGALGTANEAGICSPAYGVYRPKKHTHYNHKYFDYLYRTPHAVTEMTKNSKGIVSSRLRLYPKDFFQIQTALPDETEQTAIAAYLDTKTAQLDRKIELLGQKATQYGKLKQSLINETVTCGLDKTVAMKNSGVEWLGEVPAHWDLKRVKEVCDINKSTLSEKTSPSYEFDYVDIGSVTYGVKGFIKERMTFDVAPSRAKRIVQKGDTIISTVRTYLKAIASIDEEVSNLIVSTGFAVISPRKTMANKYCSYLLTSNCIVDEICVLSTGVSYPATNATVIGDLFFLVPPISEQHAIAAYLDEKIAHIDRIVATLNTQIDKLRELRKTLINDIVTGKICIVEQGGAGALTRPATERG